MRKLSDSRQAKVIIHCSNGGPDLRGLGDGGRSGPCSTKVESGPNFTWLLFLNTMNSRELLDHRFAWVELWKWLTARFPDQLSLRRSRGGTGACAVVIREEPAGSYDSTALRKSLGPLRTEGIGRGDSREPQRSALTTAV